MTNQASSQDSIQWLKNNPARMNGILAIPAAIAEVSPD